MGSHDGRERPENRLSEVILEADSLLTRLLNINPPASSDLIVQKLLPHEIQSLQTQITPDDYPQDLSSVLSQAVELFNSRMRLAHPRCFSYIPACPSPLARLGDLLTSVCNVNAVSWDVSSGPNTVEKSMIAWLGALLGLPESVGGCFVSGGSIANMTAITAARDEKLDPMKRANAVIYISDQAHISIRKALHITGFMDYQIHKIPSDDDFRIDLGHLQCAITKDRKAGRLPFLLVASCGSTNTGSVDPLHQLADIAQHEDLWLHVDGAYGASISLSDNHRYMVDGIGRADSVSWDGHKWLFQTYGCGIVLTRNMQSLVRSFAIDAEYLDSVMAPKGNINFYNLGPELSRPARAMSLWFTVKTLGRHRMGEMIDQGFVLAHTADCNLRRRKDWTVEAPTVTSIVVFRYTPRGLDEAALDSLNMTISERLLAENIAAILTTKIRGRTTLRMCTMNYLVKPETIDDVLLQVDRLAQSELYKAYPNMAQKLTRSSHCQDRAAAFQDSSEVYCSMCRATGVP
ncbi:hypothetical protein PENSTE_c006G09554 [Penicillium steckii]|uniref:Uncharacterized protein n=1 Tax=Penicillium steckii TaxID=303698 RepID=A0A1V6TGH0_9EURO|nr:hypothetical protein PENSTE_c006G09554 [Penicillium steckii]